MAKNLICYFQMLLRHYLPVLGVLLLSFLNTGNRLKVTKSYICQSNFYAERTISFSLILTSSGKKGSFIFLNTDVHHMWIHKIPRGKCVTFSHLSNHIKRFGKSICLPVTEFPHGRALTSHVLLGWHQLPINRLHLISHLM